MDIEKILLDKARSIGGTVVLPEGNDPRVIEAARKITDSNLAKVILLPKDDTLYTASKNDISLEGIQLIEPATSPNFKDYANKYYTMRSGKGLKLDEAEETMKNPLYYGAMMVKEGMATCMVGGAINSTPDLIRAAIRVVGTAQGTSIVSSFFVMIKKNFLNQEDRVFIFADCGLIPDPDAEQLATIAYSSSKSFEKLFDCKPKVAFLSFSTKGSAKHPKVDKVVNAFDIAKDKYPDMICDGELQLDAAVIPQVAQKKVKESAVAGQAQVLIFPDLDAGNIGYKLVERFGEATALGPILQGLDKPINDLSRGCSAKDIYLVSAISLIQSQ